MATWLKARPDGSYPTLEEVRVEAKAFIERLFKMQGEATEDVTRFSPWDAATADQFDIIGDHNLRVIDIK